MLDVLQLLKVAATFRDRGDSLQLELELGLHKSHGHGVLAPTSRRYHDRKS
jgi:hypothetical protein